jgi:hypothetical protein
MRIKTARRISSYSFIVMFALGLGLVDVWSSTSDITSRILSFGLFGLFAIFFFAFRDIYYRCPFCKHFLGMEFERYCSHCGKEVPLDAKARRSLPDHEDEDLEE